VVRYLALSPFGFVIDTPQGRHSNTSRSAFVPCQIVRTCFMGLPQAAQNTDVLGD
jgi:hypothetical protein